MIFVIVLSVFVLLFLVNRYFFNKPFIHKSVKFFQVEKYLKILRNSGYDGGFIVIENPTTKEFIQFQKHIDTKGNITLCSSFYPVNWNRNYFEPIKVYLEKEKIEYKLIEDDDKKESIEIFCNDDIALCMKITKGINIEVFGVLENELVFNVWFENVCEKDVLITSK